MLFSKFKDFKDCVKNNQDKDNPEGYCAVLHHEITGNWPAESLKIRLNKLVESYKESNQSLFHANNIFPSETLRKEGRVYGFTNVNDAINWKKKNNYKNLYQFITSDYDIDRMMYGAKGRSGEPEYICFNIIKEVIIN